MHKVRPRRIFILCTRNDTHIEDARLRSVRSPLHAMHVLAVSLLGARQYDVDPIIDVYVRSLHLLWPLDSHQCALAI